VILQVFLSSKMRRNVLAAERDVARRAIEATEVSWCWSWKQFATARSSPPMDRCLDEVKRSDAFVLILGRDLTPHTRQEYDLAVSLGIHRYVFVKEGPLLPHTRAFLTGIQSDITYQLFGNVGELQSMVKVSLKTDMALALRSLRNHRIIASPGSVGQVTSYLVRGVVARQEDSTTLIDRLRELLLDFAEQVTTDPQDLEYAREAALYVLEPVGYGRSTYRQ
jgi:hypothetical protein